MHGVLAQQVDAKLLSRLGESEQPIEGDDVSEDPATLVIVHHVKKLKRHVSPGSIRKLSILCAPIEMIYPFVLVMQGCVEYRPSRPFALKHSANEVFEIDVAMVKFVRDWTSKLKLIRLKAAH